jgi:hypothetical protein
MRGRNDQFIAKYGSDMHRDKIACDPNTSNGAKQQLAMYGNDRHRAKILMNTDSWDTAHIAKSHYQEHKLTDKSNAEIRELIAKHLKD